MSKKESQYISSDEANLVSIEIQNYPILHTKLISMFKTNYWFIWFVLGSILGGIAFLCVWLSNGVMTWIGQLALLYSVVFMMAGAGPIWLNHQLINLIPSLFIFVDLPQKEITDWYFSKLNIVFRIRGLLISGLITGLFAIISFIIQTKWYTWPSIWWGTPLGDISVTIVVGILFVFLGMWIHILINIIKLLHKIPSLPLKITVFQDKAYGISNIGSVMQRLSYFLSGGIILIALVIMLSPFRQSFGEILIAWFAILGFTNIGFFLFSQLRLHDAMKYVKTEKISVFSNHITNELEKVIIKPSKENTIYVKELFELYNHVLDMPDWPFDMQILVKVTSLLLIPMILAIVPKII